MYNAFLPETRDTVSMSRKAKKNSVNYHHIPHYYRTKPVKSHYKTVTESQHCILGKKERKKERKEKANRIIAHIHTIYQKIHIYCIFSKVTVMQFINIINNKQLKKQSMRENLKVE
jgi:hypothetical protein